MCDYHSNDYLTFIKGTCIHYHYLNIFQNVIFKTSFGISSIKFLHYQEYSECLLFIKL